MNWSVCTNVPFSIDVWNSSKLHYKRNWNCHDFAIRPENAAYLDLIRPGKPNHASLMTELPEEWAAGRNGCRFASCRLRGSQHGTPNTPVDQRLGLVSYLTHAHAHTRAVLNSCLVPAACFAAPTTCFALSIEQLSPTFKMFSHVKSCLSGTVTSKINYYRRNGKAQRRKPGTFLSCTVQNVCFSWFSLFVAPEPQPSSSFCTLSGIL